MDVIMFDAQRQGRLSFYMVCEKSPELLQTLRSQIPAEALMSIRCRQEKKALR